jgi:alpha-tubulin suppressor-like RCC1 family protein
MPSLKISLTGAILLLAAAVSVSSAAPFPPVQIALEGTNLVLTFRGQLQHAAQVQGPYTNVAGALSPLRVTWPSASVGFWRARQETSGAFDRYLSAGEQHTIALRTDGSLWGWGLNPAGWLAGSPFTWTNTPQWIATNATWSAVEAGFDYTMALQSNSTLWGWGDNGSGRQGDGTFINTNAPRPIATNATWRTISAGGAHTLAVRADGALWAWGLNQSGQLGDGTYTGALSPQPISTNAVWQAVSAGLDHSIGLRADGTLWTWGFNYAGQLGSGTFTGTNTPQPIATNATWRAIAAGGTLGASYSLAVRADGTLWAWGDNSDGQLGIGTFAGANTPQQVGINTNWQAVAAGGRHTAALQADGSLWIWGWNESGQLGNGMDGPFDSKNTPQRIGTQTTWLAVTAGREHTVALRTDGSLWAWGDNSWGQLGTGTFDNANTPQPVLGGAVWGAPLP